MKRSTSLGSNGAQVLDRMSEALAVRLTDALDFGGVPAVPTHDGQHLQDVLRDRDASSYL